MYVLNYRKILRNIKDIYIITNENTINNLYN